MLLKVSSSIASNMVSELQVRRVGCRDKCLDVYKRQAHTTSQIASNPNQAKYLQTVGRQQKVKEALYLFLLQKREENELSKAFTAYNTQMCIRDRI